MKGEREKGEKRGNKKRRWLRRREKDRKEKQDISGNVKKERGEERKESVEKSKPETECAKTGMCRMGTCRGGEGHGGSESTTDRHFEGQRADGRCGAQPPEQPPRLRERNGEREWNQKVEREHVAFCTGLAEQRNRNNGHHSSSTSSSRSLAHAVTSVSRAGEARCQDQVPCS